MDVARLVNGYSYWTFSDIFTENYMPSLPFQGGFGLLTLEGVPKPAYRAFELLHRLGTDELIVDGVHETVRVWAIRRERSITMLVTNHALPRHPVAYRGWSTSSSRGCRRPRSPTSSASTTTTPTPSGRGKRWSAGVPEPSTHRAAARGISPREGAARRDLPGPHDTAGRGPPAPRCCGDHHRVRAFAGR